MAFRDEPGLVHLNDEFNVPVALWPLGTDHAGLIQNQIKVHFSVLSFCIKISKALKSLEDPLRENGSHVGCFEQQIKTHKRLK